MKAILLTTMLLCFAQLGYGQKKVHQVILEVEPISTKEDWYIDEIIDKRLVQNNIGYVLAGIENWPVC